ncbi:phosphate ABC transporter permease subunit PstC [Parapedobacter indicus]|uniref:Phosphate transport system permease protein n=1 Tax=Parapedobacter indicus TaxID=1477437 RepID=A0A1I3IDK8_9SPHI|nr:phosphate ABC transporter permease subunit PstC [Parapedobacter indicus]PPL02122.1 phosphate transport system permease protein [Parapedobacter indicus]SFI46064.1 phosphate transport system permease protein [Parapedobacter indicus]
MNFRIVKDKLIANVMLILSISSVSFVFLIGIGLYLRAAPLFEEHTLLSLFRGSNWAPSKNQFGFYPFIMGTLSVTLIAIVVALPLCLLTAIYLTEYAKPGIRKVMLPLMNILAGIPPVIYGVWGIFFVVPIVREYIAPQFMEYSSGYTVLTGGVVLAVMIFPILVSIVSEVLSTIPKELKDASLSLGATKWETIKKVVVKRARPGIVAAMVLAVSRAFGETIAVLMVCGNVPVAPTSVFDGGYPLPALIANNFGEMMSIPLYDSALMFAALLLFVIIFLFNLISRIILNRIEHKYSS